MTTIAQRFARVTQPSIAKVAAAAGLSVLGLAITNDMRGAIESIVAKIDAAESRRAEIEARRKELLLGDDEAELTRAENDLAAVDRELGRLRDAREIAAERAAADDAAKAAETYARDLAAWEERNVELVALAERGDVRAREAVEIFTQVADKAEEQARTCPYALGGFPSERPLGAGRAATAARNALAAAGLDWAWQTPFRWPLPPTISQTIAGGLDWARGEIRRNGQRTSKPDRAA